MRNRAAVALAAGSLIGFSAAALTGAHSAGDLNENFPFPATPESQTEVLVPSDAREDVTIPSPIQEDDPNWDCRINGNQACGVEIHGVWYVIQFRDGSPESVTYRQ